MPANCTEHPASVLREMPEWRLYAESANAFLVSGVYPIMGTMGTGDRNETHFQRLQDDFLNGMLAHGCEYFGRPRVIESLTTVHPEIDFCDPESPVLKGRRSLRPLCPKTCGCSSKVKEDHLRLGTNWTTNMAETTQCAQACFAS